MGPDNIQRISKGPDNLQHCSTGPDNLQHGSTGPDSIQNGSTGPDSIQHSSLMKKNKKLEKHFHSKGYFYIQNYLLLSIRKLKYILIGNKYR